MGLAWQLFGTLVVCYLSLIMGFVFTWPSSTYNLFESTNTTLLRPMKQTELALLGSLSSIGALISTPFFGYALDKIGRRYTMIMAGVPYVLSWTIIASSRQVEMILAAMFLSGVGGAAFLVTPVFISEICQDSIRGTMTAGSVVFMGLGCLISYITGGYLPYNINVYSQLTFCVIYLILVFFLRESPMFLLQKGSEERAAKSIAFYRSLQPDSEEVLTEIKKMKRILNSVVEDVEEKTTEKQKLDENPIKPTLKRLSPWRFLLNSKSSKRGLWIILTLVTSSIFMGLVVVQVYAEPLFMQVVPSMSANLCSILFAVVGIIANVISASLIDVAGRKVLMISSGVLSGIFTLLLGTQLQLEWAPPILTAVFIYMFCVAYCLGAGSIPYVLVAEIFLPEVKGFCSMLAIEWAWLTNFIILLIFNPLVEVAGLGPVFYIFSATSFGTAVFCFFLLPETKGLPADVIQGLLVKK